MLNYVGILREHDFYISLCISYQSSIVLVFYLFVFIIIIILTQLGRLIVKAPEH